MAGAVMDRVFAGEAMPGRDAGRHMGMGVPVDTTPGVEDMTVPVDTTRPGDAYMTMLVDTAEPGVEGDPGPVDTTEPGVEGDPELGDDARPGIAAFGCSQQPTDDDEMKRVARCLKSEWSDPNASVFTIESKSDAECGDLDEDAVYSQQEPQRAGLQQLFNVIPEAPAILRRRVLDLGALDVEEQMLMAATQDQVLSSVFTGTGSFEASAAWIIEALHKEMLRQPEMHHAGRLIVYSHCETDADAVNFTMNMPEAFQPLHRFGNIRERLFETDRRRIEAIKKSYDEQAGELKAWRSLDLEGRDWEWKHRVKGLQQAICKDLMNELKQMEFRETCFCKCHLKECNISPWSQKEFRNMRWTEAGGNVCTPWSLMGSMLGWLDDGAIDALIWAYSSKYYGPHTILQECTPYFDIDIFRRILANVDDSPRSLYSFEAARPSNTQEEASEEVSPSKNQKIVMRPQQACTIVSLSSSPQWTSGCRPRGNGCTRGTTTWVC